LIELIENNWLKALFFSSFITGGGIMPLI